MSQKKSEPPPAQKPPTDKWEEFRAWRDRPSTPGTDVCCYCGTDNGPAGISRIGGYNCYWCMGN
jgi:hypothetical protein